MTRPCRAFAPILLACAVVALDGCATMRSTSGPPIPLDGETLLDDYVLAHGFAAGRVLSADADRKTVLDIIQLDHQALFALSVSAANPASGLAAERARAAIEALALYAAR